MKGERNAAMPTYGSHDPTKDGPARLTLSQEQVTFLHAHSLESSYEDTSTRPCRRTSRLSCISSRQGTHRRKAIGSGSGTRQVAPFRVASPIDEGSRNAGCSVIGIDAAGLPDRVGHGRDTG